MVARLGGGNGIPSRPSAKSKMVPLPPATRVQGVLTSQTSSAKVS